MTTSKDPRPQHPGPKEAENQMTELDLYSWVEQEELDRDEDLYRTFMGMDDDDDEPK